MRGDVRGLFGVPGLNGELLSFQSSDPDKPVKEVVKPDFGSFLMDRWQDCLYIDSDMIQQLPIQNVQFSYSEEIDEFLNLAGSSPNADITFSGPLTPSTTFSRTFTPAMQENTPPSKLQVSARLSAERD